jgi:chromosome segregation ATPase
MLEEIKKRSIFETDDTKDFWFGLKEEKREELEELRTTVSNLERKLELLRNTVKDIEQKIEKLENKEIPDLTDIVKAIKQLRENFEALSHQYLTVHKDSKAYIGEQQSRIEDIENALQSYKLELETIKDSITTLTAKIDQIKAISSIQKETALPPLTEKQQRIHDLILERKTHKEIASDIGVSEAYISQVVRAIRRKGYKI